MPFPLKITYREVHESTELERLVQQEASKLDRFFDRIVSCRVTIERAYAKHRDGDPFRVRIVLSVPGDELCITQLPDMRGTLIGSEEQRVRKSAEIDAPYKSAEYAVREAFKKARRQLQDHVRKLIESGRHVSATRSIEEPTRTTARKGQENT